MKNLIKKQEEEFKSKVCSSAILGGFDMPICAGKKAFKNLEDFISKVRKETAEYERERTEQNIGLLRQYINERESDELITDEEIKSFIIN